MKWLGRKNPRLGLSATLFVLLALFVVSVLSVAVALAAIFYSAGPQVGYFDFGDNPDSYHTEILSNGARHEDGTLEWLGGLSPDYETDAAASYLSSSDDGNGTTPDDEDGVSFYSDRTEIMVSVADHLSGRYGAADLVYVDGWVDTISRTRSISFSPIPAGIF